MKWRVFNYNLLGHQGALDHIREDVLKQHVRRHGQRIRPPKQLQTVRASHLDQLRRARCLLRCSPRRAFSWGHIGGVRPATGQQYTKALERPRRTSRAGSPPSMAAVVGLVNINIMLTWRRTPPWSSRSDTSFDSYGVWSCRREKNALEYYLWLIYKSGMQIAESPTGKDYEWATQTIEYKCSSNALVVIVMHISWALVQLPGKIIFSFDHGVLAQDVKFATSN